jgi:hypothetical protein
MSKISWQYIAGFFDGEGCISFNHRRGQNPNWYAVQLSMCQKEKAVLIEIQKFLKENQIKSSLYSRKDKQMFSLGVGKTGEIIELVNKLLPFLIVKKEKCKKALKFINKYKLKNPQLTIREQKKILKMHHAGKARMEISRLLGRNYETIRDFLFKEIGLTGHEKGRNKK